MKFHDTYLLEKCPIDRANIELGFKGEDRTRQEERRKKKGRKKYPTDAGRIKV